MACDFTKASALRTCTITGYRTYLEKEGPGGSLHLRAMTGEGISQSPQLARLPEAGRITGSIRMWDVGRVPYYNAGGKQFLGLTQEMPMSP